MLIRYNLSLLNKINTYVYEPYLALVHLIYIRNSGST
jgi:hypothetical protein